MILIQIFSFHKLMSTVRVSIVRLSIFLSELSCARMPSSLFTSLPSPSLPVSLPVSLPPCFPPPSLSVALPAFLSAFPPFPSRAIRTKRRYTPLLYILHSRYHLVFLLFLTMARLDETKCYLATILKYQCQLNHARVYQFF